MLPAAHRLTDAASFREATRRGRRASRPTLVTYLLSPEPPQGPPARVGFVVSKAVGNAVARNRVQRRLRHLVSPWVSSLGDGSVLVVRALPPAAAAGSAALDRDLAACLGRSGVVTGAQA